MRAFAAALVTSLVGVLGIAACSGQVESIESRKGEGPAANATIRVTPFVPEKVWKPTSVRIDVYRGYPLSVGQHYGKDRVDMPPEQLAALDELRTKPDEGPLRELELHVSVVIVDADGTSATYTTTSPDQVGGNLSYASMTPFLGTYRCLENGAPSQCNVDPDRTPSEPWRSCAPTLDTDPGCYNNLWVPVTCGDEWIGFKVDEPGTYTLALNACIEETGFRLADPNGGADLASSPIGVDPSCPHLTYTFTSAGTYPFVVQKRNQAGCPSSDTGGCTILRVTREPQ